MFVISLSFGASQFGITLSDLVRFGLTFLDGLLMLCRVGLATAVIVDVTHSIARSTGASILSLLQNPFGVARGPEFAKPTTFAETQPWR